MPKFMIHKHTAKRAGLHHDLRLELDGVYKSWAIPKTIDPKTDAKRLAIKVGDHSLEYGEWEGVIEEGYGAGEVEIWDSGVYEPIKIGDKKWEIIFYGTKLNGTWLLTKMYHNKWLFLGNNCDILRRIGCRICG